LKGENSLPMKETLTRSLTGIVFVALIIFSLLLHPVAYLVLFGLACTGAWIEITRLFPERFSPAMAIAGTVLVDACFLLVFFFASGSLSGTWLLLFPAALLLIAIPAGFTGPTPGRSPALLIPLIIWLTAGFSSMHLLAWLPGKDASYSPRWILFTFYLLWMNDTLAYVTGRLMGKHPIWPRVSPSKTWEGAVGGTFFTLALAIVFSMYFTRLSLLEWTVFAILVILFGSLGDFLESWIKRKAGVKDSGSLLPGHGGILDRFDSFLLSMPFVTIFLYFAL
jgi:phosphatidate cytidylyltransferase